MTKKVQIMPETIRIALLEYPGAQRSALLGMEDMFALASRLADDGTRFEALVEPAPGPAARVVILPPALGLGTGFSVPEPLKQALRAAHAAGVLTASVCAGSLVLADCGLLDHRPATTHWALEAGFRARFPEVALDPARMVIDDGDIVTAGGLLAWADLVLHLVGRLHSPALRSALAHHCLVDPAGRAQSHYARFLPRFDHGDDRVRAVQHWLAGRLGQAVSVDAMAAEAGMAPRSFVRHFKAATGQAPGAYLQLLRLARAQDRLETSRAPVAEIAWEVGYDDVSAFRRAFQARTGLAPGAYRQRFRAGAAA
jgi:transcriptional regulator GlxA family with amidase domain